MKLYTESDLIELVQSLKEYTHESHAILGHDEREAKDFVDIFLKDRTPIELPSDEEIENKADDYVENDHILFVTNSRNSKRYGFADGAKWIRDKILNQNK